MLRDQIKQIVESAIDAAQAAGNLPTVEIPSAEIMRPKQAEHGDYSTNVAMVVAANIRKATGEKSNPRQIAQAIVDQLGTSDLIGKVELAGPGFINLHLADSWLQQQVAVINAAGEVFGNIDRGQGRRWQVEYVSANPTGPIHYGGARNAVLGDSLANVLEAAGYDIQREFYVNDAGNQFKIFAQSILARYKQLFGQDVSVPEDGYQGEYLLAYAQGIIDEHGDRFLAMDEAEAVLELKILGRAIVLSELEKELARIGVQFDRWFSEQSLYDSGLVEQKLADLEAKGELAQRDGAVWFLASKYPKNDKDEVVIRQNGIPTYFASDIAYHYDKFVVRGFEQVINVWSVDHQGHVPRMNAVMEALGLEPERLTLLIYNLVKLMRDGKEIKLSKRAGNLVTINDVVDEVGSDALRFNLLTRDPNSPIDFDLDAAVAQVNENPVYYVQYSHARICSILAKAQEEGMMDDSTEVNLTLLDHLSELILIRKLLDIEEQIDLVVEKLSPHNLTHYVIELSKNFSGFYRDCKVVDGDEPALSQARLALCQATRVVLAKVLGLLGVHAPERM